MEYRTEYTLPELLEELPLNASKLAELIGINPALMRYYKTNPAGYMSDDRRQLIEDELHRMGAALAELKLK